MLAAGIKTPVPLEELEIHLRQEIERQMKSGLGEHQAFETAVQRVGQAGALKTEFAKTGGARREVILFLLSWCALSGCLIQFGLTPLALVYGIFFFGLIAVAASDFESLSIPDKITLRGIYIGFICSALLPQLQGQSNATAGMLQSLLGIIAGAGLFNFILRTGQWLFGRQRLVLGSATRVIFTETALQLPRKTIPYRNLFQRKSYAIELHAQSVLAGDRFYQNVPVRLTAGSLKIGDDDFSPGQITHMEVCCSEIVLPREAMGFGDVKFMAAVGAFLGWRAVFFILVVSSILGSIAGIGLITARRREWSSRIAYGPYLALAAAIWVFGGKHFFEAMFAH